MKTKKELLQDYLDAAQEALIKIEIRSEYVQNKHGADGRNAWLQELAELTANKKETEEWVGFIKGKL